MLLLELDGRLLDLAGRSFVVLVKDALKIVFEAFTVLDCCTILHEDDNELISNHFFVLQFLVEQIQSLLCLLS